MNNKFWDRNGDDKFDLADIFRIALPLVSYSLGIVLMLFTATRSWHLLSSPQFNPVLGTWLFGWLWPIVTAASAELGLGLSWISLEIGIRRGRLSRSDWSMILMIGLGTIGFLGFAVLIGIMQLYDVDLIQKKDMTEAAGWGHTIASLLPLFTIGYATIVSSAYAALERREKELRVYDRQWQVQESHPRLPVGRSPTSEQEEYGEPLTDPLSQSVGGRRVRPNPKGHQPQTVTRQQGVVDAMIRSIGSNGKSENGDSNFT